MRLILAAGFSLIELMIVVAIIGILAMIAVPSYRSYTERARFAELISTADFYKTAVTLALQQGAPLNAIANGSEGVPAEPAPTKNIASVTVINGVITATGTDLVHDDTYSLTPNDDGSVWTVGGTCIQDGLCHE